MAKDDTHPLTGNRKWTFNQPDVGYRAHYVAVEREVDDPERELMTVEASSTCREGVISSTREVFQARLTNANKVNEASQAGWKSKKPTWAPTRDCDLIDLAGKVQPTQLKLQWHKNWMKTWEDFPVEKFLQVCDVVIGPVSVLLGPWRPKGEDWWRTDPKTALQSKGEQKYVYWQGTDSWFLAHPSTAAIATGLYRQCFHLCGAGIADEVIQTLSEDELVEVMSTNTLKLAMRAVKKTRPWIEVPVGENGNRMNYAFPFGFWRRLMRLQRAIRRHGYEESLGQTFHEGWATTGQNAWSGLHGFWGTEGELSSHHTHLMKMGAPRRKKSDKSAAKDT